MQISYCLSSFVMHCSIVSKFYKKPATSNAPPLLVWQFIRLVVVAVINAWIQRTAPNYHVSFFPTSFFKRQFFKTFSSRRQLILREKFWCRRIWLWREGWRMSPWMSRQCIRAPWWDCTESQRWTPQASRSIQWEAADRSGTRPATLSVSSPTQNAPSDV